MSGYLRPRLTDKQAALVYRELLRAEDRLPGRTLEARMLRDAAQAILKAERDRAWRQALVEDAWRSEPVEQQRGWRRWVRRERRSA